MKHVQGISLDLDDTLWDVWSVIGRAEAALHRHIQAHYPDVARRYDADAIRELRNQIVETRPDIAYDLTESRRVSFAQMLESCGENPEDSHALMAYFLELRHEVELFPDVEPALKALSARYDLIALSNGNADVRRLPIGPLFKGQVSAASAGVKKPDRHIFEVGCQELGMDPGAVLHVGDHPFEDVLGAKDAGLSAVWVNRTAASWPHPQQPDAEVKDMAELVVLLESV